MDESEIIKLGKDICQALIACGEMNIIHRDINPENIMYSKYGYKLADFGVARVMDHSTNGTIAGTERYMAPEIIRQEEYGNSVDLYSLGLVMYWFLNNRRMPFWPQVNKPPRSREIAEAQSLRVRGEPLPAPINGSPQLQQIVLKACSYSREDRYNDASEMLSALESLTTCQKTDIPLVLLEDKPKENTSDPDPIRETLEKLASEQTINPHLDQNETKVKSNKKVFLICTCAIAAIFIIFLIVRGMSHSPTPDPVSQAAISEDSDFVTDDLDTEETVDDETIKKTGNRIEGREKYGFTWTLENHVLTISGSGAMDNYNGTHNHMPRWSLFSDEIQEVVLLNGITSVGNDAFSKHTEITTVTLPDSVIFIGSHAFSGCENLKNIRFSNQLKTIGWGAFSYCESLSTISLPDSLAVIDSDAFSSCKSLTGIEIPESVSTIGSGAFTWCNSLAEIHVDVSNGYYHSIDGVLFRRDSTYYDILHTYPAGKSATTYTIPEFVNTIGKHAFYPCNLTGLTIPKQVTSIEEGAICFDANLEYIYYDGSRYDWDTIKIQKYNKLPKDIIHFGIEEYQ